MLPVLYRKDEIDFGHNGIGILKDTIEAVAVEELNGIFELRLEYDMDGYLVDELEEEVIIKAKANDTQEPQLFRVYSLTKNHENGTVTVDAQHITYDAAHDFVEELEVSDVTKDDVMKMIMVNAEGNSGIRFSSSNKTTRSSTKLYRTNPLQMVAGMQGSILQIWGGQIERDNHDLILHDRRGADNGVSVSYTKNLTGLEVEFSVEDVVTRIYPFKIIQGEEGKSDTLLTIPNKFIDSPLKGTYRVERILPVDYSDDESIETGEQLLNKAKTYFDSGSKDKPSMKMTVKFEPLYGTEEYKKLAVLEKVGMGDTISVTHKELGVDTKAPVNKIEYDVLNERNIAVEVGQVQSRLTSNVNNVEQVTDQLQSIDKNINNILNATNGKNKIFWGPDEPTSGMSENDLWYKVVDGEFTQTYLYDGVQWQLIIDTNTEGLQNEIDDIKNGIEDTLGKLDDAFDKIELDSEKLNDAIGKIEEDSIKIEDAVGKIEEGTIKIDGAVELVETNIGKIDASFDKAQEALDKADSLSTVVDEQTGDISEIKQVAQGIQTTVGNIILGKNILPGMEFGSVLWDGEDDNSEVAKSLYIRSPKIRVNYGEKFVFSRYGEKIISEFFNNRLEIHHMGEDGVVLGQVYQENVIDIFDEEVKYIRITMYRPDTHEEEKESDWDVLKGYQLERVEENTEATEYVPYLGTDGEIYRSMSKIIQTVDGISLTVGGLVTNKNKFPGFTNGTLVGPDDEDVTGLMSKIIPLSQGVKYLLSRDGNTVYLPGYRFFEYDEEDNLLGEIEGETHQEVGYITLQDPEAKGLRIVKIGEYEQYDDLTQLEVMPEDGMPTEYVPYVESNGDFLNELSEMTQTVKGFELKVQNIEGDITRLTQTVKGFENRVEDVEGNVTTLTQTVEGFENRVESVEGNVTTLTQTVEGFENRVESVEGNVSTLTQTVEGFENRVESVEGNMSTLTQTVEGFENRVESVEGNVSALTQTVDGFKSRVEDVEGNITTLTQTVKGFENRVESVEGNVSTLTQTVNGINSKVESVEGNVSTLTQTVKGFQSKVESVEGSVSALTQTVDGFKGRVESVEGNVSTLTQTVNGIKTQVKDVEGNITTLTQTVNGVKSQVKDVEGNITTLTQTVNGFKTQVKDVEGNVSTLTQTVNGLKSQVKDVEGNVTTLTQTSQGLQSKVEGMFNGKNLLPPMYRGSINEDTGEEIAALEGRASKYISSRIRLESGVSYKLSFKDNEMSSVRMYKYTKVRGENSYEDAYIGYETITNGNITLKDNVVEIRIEADFSGDTGVTVYGMLEEGKVVTGYVPYVHGVSRSQITQLQDTINLRVQKGDIINQINISTEEILISGKRLLLDGNVTVNGSFKVKAANIESVNANSIRTGTLDAAFVSVINLNASSIKTGSLDANKIKITATNGKSKLDLSSTGLQSYDNSGIMRIALNIRSVGGKGSDPATLRFFSGDGKISAGIGMNVNDTFIIGSESNKLAMELRAHQTKNIIYYGREHRFVTKNESNNNFNSRYFILKTRSSGTRQHPVLEPDTSGLGYLGTPSYRLFRVYTNYLHYIDLVNLSSRDSKDNINEASVEQMQKAFDEMQLVTYNYKNPDGTKRSDELKVGWIAEDSPDLITSKNKKQLSLNNTLGVMAGSMKYQQNRVDKLEKDLEELKKENARLEQRIVELEVA